MNRVVSESFQVWMSCWVTAAGRVPSAELSANPEIRSAYLGI